ncbi:Hypothetical_protein [Hexamita inflata]|uniref:Hypothetical_protein n=1 Tax=Hexamita inflata TaxID=28002 RepID=A0AA86NE95_9EUKA|nr:Hypothetical protein HINF_LOCUS5198 [Hexamita inflata]
MIIIMRHPYVKVANCLASEIFINFVLKIITVFNGSGHILQHSRVQGYIKGLFEQLFSDRISFLRLTKITVTTAFWQALLLQQQYANSSVLLTRQDRTIPTQYFKNEHKLRDYCGTRSKILDCTKLLNIFVQQLDECQVK